MRVITNNDWNDTDHVDPVAADRIDVAPPPTSAGSLAVAGRSGSTSSLYAWHRQQQQQHAGGSAENRRALPRNTRNGVHIIDGPMNR